MEKAPDAIATLAREIGRQLSFPEGVPNFEPGDVRITDRAPIVRATAAGPLELVVRRWSWPLANGKPVFNWRSEGRSLPPEGRCVVLADGFYEYTAPADPKAKRKDRWLFTWPGHEWFGIAGMWRRDAAVGEAFTLLTCEPGPDVAPLHNRQVVLLSPRECFEWLDPGRAAEDFLHPSPAGTLAVAAA